MVAGSTHLLVTHSIIVRAICRLCSGPIYLFLILMKRIILILTQFAKVINGCIVCILLSIVFVVICGYHFFHKRDYRNWQNEEKHVAGLEQTKHLW